MPTRRTLRLTALVFAAALCLLPATAQAAGETIAVVDIATLIQKHPDADTLDERFQKAKDSAKANWDSQQDRLKELLGKIGKMQQGPERTFEQRKYEQQKVMAEFSRRWAEREALTAYVRALEKIYADVATHVRTYARTNNIQLVLQRETTPGKIESANLDDFFVKLRLRTVLYNSADLDITAKVLDAMAKARGG